MDGIQIVDFSSLTEISVPRSFVQPVFESSFLNSALLQRIPRATGFLDFEHLFNSHADPGAENSDEVSETLPVPPLSDFASLQPFLHFSWR